MTAATARPYTVGLTGGVASGKSTVQSLFESLGVPVLDADVVARRIVEPGMPALARIAEVFGAGMLTADGRLDRRRMRMHVFADPAARRQLEAITHPLIREALADWQRAQHSAYCMLSVAILVEAGMRPLVDRVLVVDAPPELQIQRLQLRDGIDATLAAQMLAAQAGRAQRLAQADDVIENTAALDALRTRVEALHQHYLAQAAAIPAPRLPDPSI